MKTPGTTMIRHAALAILAALSLAACRQDAAPPAPAAPTAPEAASVAADPAAAPAEPKPGSELSVTQVETGADVGTDLRVITTQDNFAPNETVIVAITLANASAAPVNGQVTARWVGPDGQIFNEESQQKDFSGHQTVNFRVAEPKGFKPGNYKLEIALNGSVVQTHDFSIR